MTSMIGKDAINSVVKGEQLKAVATVVVIEERNEVVAAKTGLRGNPFYTNTVFQTLS